jgi:addiction module RelE/StbE family toxin
VQYYEIRLTREAVKDVQKLTPKLKQKLQAILTKSISPFPYIGKRLVGDLQGFYSVRLTYKDRIVYTINEHEKIVFIHRAKTHYGE